MTTIREAANWLGVPEGEDVFDLMNVPSFRRALAYVVRTKADLNSQPWEVLERFDLPTTRNAELDLPWLRETARKCRA